MTSINQFIIYSLKIVSRAGFVQLRVHIQEESMRYKRAIITTLVCFAGYMCSGILICTLLDLFPYQWENNGSVELNYIHPLVMDNVDDYSTIYDIQHRVRILCWTFLEYGDRPYEMRIKFGHISVTWGQKCTTIVYISDGNVKLFFSKKMKINH